MARFVVDSWAWLEYLEGTEKGKAVEERFAGDAELWTSTVTLTEVVSKYRRKGMSDDAAIRALTSMSKVQGPSREDAIEAARNHAQVKAKSPNFSLADATVLQLARKLRARVLTGDPDFAGVEDSTPVG